MVALYEINGDIALQIALSSFDSVLTLSNWAYEDSDATAIATDCKNLRDKATKLLRSGSGSERV
ncbi:hypothetical protein JCM17844_20000 [Iodidimonas gelatinilytica]|uniref:Uncharacterized protein n=1 Tax=Iodidimonas gelatinilytica TaxID=1236966 RepID=A0A5A7MSZ1_9PROT|nr:hypothetical protein JCM17844_20000 [Iodidimonas gelatinilytica]